MVLESLVYIIKQILTFLNNTRTLPHFTDTARRFIKFRTKKSDACNPSDGEADTSPSAQPNG